MSAASCSFSPNSYPYGKDETLNHARLEGTIAVAAGTYPANGIPVSFVSNLVSANVSPFVAWLESQSFGWVYKFDPTYQTMHIFQSAQFAGGYPPGVVAANFAASANMGTTVTLAPSATSNQQAFALTVTPSGAGIGANGYITLTFPVPYVQAPTFVCCRGDSLADAGYWVFTSSTTTAAIFTFIGTPTTGHVYVLEAYGIASNLAQPAITAAAFSISAGWGATSALTILGTSTQNAFAIQIADSGGTYGANPTITLTFPTPYATAPQFVCCRVDALSNAGYLVFTSSTTTTATFTFIGTAAAVTYKFAAILLQPKASALAASNFAASANFGTGAAVSVTGNMGAFTASVAAGSASTGANPTLTLTFPVTLGQAPNAVVCRGDSQSTAGYWVVTSTSTTTLVLTFVGTPAASTTYIADVFVQLYAPGEEELPVGATVPASVIADTIYVEAITTRV